MMLTTIGLNTKSTCNNRQNACQLIQELATLYNLNSYPFFYQNSKPTLLRMEILSVQGSKIESVIIPGQTQELGRSNGFNSSDKTISRRHVSFFNPSHDRCLQFEVLGINPIYVYRNDEVKVYRRFERGEMESGDAFCVSAKNPTWYTLRKSGYGGESAADNALESELADRLESGSGFNGVEDLQPEGVDFSDVDYVKEFGFVVMGHEFDSYLRKMNRNMRNWDWFLEEPADNSEDEESSRKKMRVRGTRKRKKGEKNDDEDWTGESEDEKELANTSKKAQNTKYMTRSKDHGRSSKDRSKSKIPIRKETKDNRSMDHEGMEDEYGEEDETLGGFIVDDENLEDEEEFADEEEEEDELGDED